MPVASVCSPVRGIGIPVRLITARLPLLARASSLLLNALMAVVIARLFGAAASGAFFLAFAAINFAGMIGRLGTDMQVIKTVPGLFHGGKLDLLWREMDWLRRYCLQGSLAAGVITATIGLVLWATGASPEVGIPLAILSISVPFSSRAIVESAALRSANRLSRGAFAETGLSQGLTILLLLVSAVAFHPGGVAIPVCYSIATVGTSIVARIWTKNAIQRTMQQSIEVGFRPPPGLRAAMLHMMGSSVLFFALTSTPLFVLGIFATVRDVGLYNAATRVSTLVAIIPALQTTYLVPRVSRTVAVHDIEAANVVLRRAARQASGVTVLLGVGILLFASPILGIFGSDFANAQATLMVLLIGQMAISSLGNVNPVMSVVGLERPSVVYVGIALAAGLVPMAFVAVYWGAAGVALVFVLVSIAYAIACGALLQRRLGIRCFVS